MRWIIITSALCLLTWSNPDSRIWFEDLFDQRVDPRVEAAVELRCASEHEAFRDECAVELKRDFELGKSEPEAILRRHCTRISNAWATKAIAADSICEELYGGWLES